MQRDRGALQRLGAERVDERGAREDDRVARLDRLAPHLREHIRVRTERRGLALGGPMDEIGELTGLVAREKEPCAADEEHLRAADT